MSRIVLGMSGGVDSSVVAAMLKGEGHEVFGVYLQMHDIGAESIDDARRVADHVGIPMEVVDARERFDRIVVGDFLDCYTHGRTPNPCVLCNPTVKFHLLLSYADKVGADWVATGHYARVVQDPDTGRYAVACAGDKDQSYMLCRLTQDQLARIYFPLGDTVKSDNRAKASDFGLDVADKPDSQEICFIRDIPYGTFIEQRLGTFPEGDYWLEEEDRAVGKHRGIIYYTVGQRKKLGISLGVPAYVKRIEPETNRVVLSKRDVTDYTEMYCTDLVFQGLSPDTGTFCAAVKTRFGKRSASCTAKIENGVLTATFEEPQRAITAGQSAVFYRDDRILCSGIIL